MYVTACLAGQQEDVEVGEDCRTLPALKAAIVVALPQLCVEGFDLSVGGRVLDGDDGVVSLNGSMSLDVVPNTRGLSVLALREAGREVSEAGLLEAAADGNTSLCALYLDAGVPIDCVDPSGFTSLHRSCQNGFLPVVTLLLDRGSRAIDDKGFDGRTPLLKACSNGHVEVARLLLDRGSNAIDERANDHWTPLHHACSRGSLPLARLLLDRGSKAIDEKDCDSWTPLHHSCCRGSVSLVTLLLDRGSRAIDEKETGGWTPLHLSAESGALEIATLLLDRGSNALDEQNCLKETPLQRACVFNYFPLITLFLDRGCSVNVKDIKYPTESSYSHEVLELLSERGHDVLPDVSR